MDYSQWLSGEYWSVKTFLFLCEGKNPAAQPHVIPIYGGYVPSHAPGETPPEPKPPTPAERLEKQIAKAGREGELVPRAGATVDYGNWEFPPLALIRFALSAGFAVPQPLEDFASKKRTPKGRRRRRITYAIERARGVLIARQKKEPTARAVFDWLADYDDTGVIDDVDRDTNTLTWITDSENLADATFKTVQNTLTDIRKRNPG